MGHILKRSLTVPDYDSIGNEIDISGTYILEWLRKNMLPNASFENWTTTDLDDWKIDGTVNKLDSDPKYGSYGVIIDSSGGVSSIETSAKISIEKLRTKKLRLTGWSKTTETVLGYTITYYTSSGGSTGVTEKGTITLVSDSVTWSAFSSIISLSSRTSVCNQIVVKLYGSEGIIKLDGVSLTSYNPDNLEAFASFTALNTDDLETFTFPASPLSRSNMHDQDDPVSTVQFDDGSIRTEKRRESVQGWTLVFRLVGVEQINQMRRFHKKSRGETLIWYDSDYCINRSVIWTGALKIEQKIPTVAVVSIDLIETAAYAGI